MMKCLKYLLVLFVITAFTMSYGTATAEAGEGDIASGQCGTCDWVIDADGVLTISGGEMDDCVSPPWYDYNEQITAVKTTGRVVLKTARCMFYNCKYMTTADISQFDFTNVTDMCAMFWRCSSLQSLDLSHADTSNVTNMSQLFSGCGALTSLDLSNFDTSSAVNMGEMFSGCCALESLDLSNFDTSKVTDMNRMFVGICVPVLDLSSFNTSNVTNMRGMFAGVKSDVIDYSSFDTSNVLDMQEMFASRNVPELDLTGLVIPENADLTDMLKNVKKVKTGNWEGTTNRPLLPMGMMDTTTMIHYDEGEMFPAVNGHTFVEMINTTGGYTITNVTLNKTTLEWGDTLEVAVDYIGTEPVVHSTSTFLHSDYLNRANYPDIPDEYFCYNFVPDQTHDSFDSASGTGTFTIKTRISCMQEIGTYPTFRIHLFGEHSIEDILDGAEFLDLYALEIKAPHRDPVFEKNYADAGLYDALNNLQDGDAAILRCEILHDSMIPAEKRIPNHYGLKYSLVKSEYYNAIKGKDITLIIPIHTRIYAEINGMDVGENIEDVYFTGTSDLSIRCEPNGNGSFNIQLFQGFPNNGTLPAKTSYRFSKLNWTAYILFDLYQYNAVNPNQIVKKFLDDACLYYLKDGQTAVKDGKYSQDGDWIVMTLDHNSDYVLTNSDPRKIRTFKASIPKKSYIYNGKVQKPSVTLKTVTGYGEKRDYSIIYSNSKSKLVGTYTITVKPKAIGFGKQTLTYKINPKGTTISKLSALRKGFKATIKKNKTQTTGYQIRYSTKSSMAGSKIITIKSNKTTSKKVKKLKAKKKYYVQVRTYKTVKGVRYYSAWSKKMAVKTKK